MNILKLNLGSGEVDLPGYENLDRKKGNEVYPLVAYADNSVDEIRASHVLEHFGYSEVMAVLTNWVSKIRPGGVLKIAVPDFRKLTEMYLGGDKEFSPALICGSQADKDDVHKSIFDEKGLRKAFECLGLVDVKPWISEIRDCASYLISLNLQGTKAESVKIDGEIGYLVKEQEKVMRDIFKKARNVYSQNGEDGLIEAIFDKIGVENKWCLEVGAADGLMFSNTRRLVEQGWNAILIEKDKNLYDRLVKNCADFQNVKALNFEIDTKENNLDFVLEKHGAPKDLDLVCIDVDGQDWHIWNQMIKFRPRVIIVEYSYKPEDADFIPTLNGVGQAGKTAIYKLAASKRYHNFISTQYNIIAIRNDIAEKFLGQQKEPDKLQKVKIAAVMSMPRLSFTDNMFSAVRSLLPLGIVLDKGSGVFWGQVLTRLMELHLDDGTEYIITVDYDTFFTKNYVVKMLQLMQENPRADAIIPLQMKRECDCPLVGKKGENEKGLDKIPASEFDKELMPITVGHFGLTVFRVSALKKLKKPWFMPKPDPEGGWNEGHFDEDIYFWHNFTASGLQAYLAPRIGLPHLQLLATLPGKLQDGFKPLHYYISDLEKNGIPDWCEPKVEYLK